MGEGRILNLLILLQRKHFRHIDTKKITHKMDIISFVSRILEPLLPLPRKGFYTHITSFVRLSVKKKFIVVIQKVNFGPWYAPNLENGNSYQKISFDLP